MAPIVTEVAIFNLKKEYTNEELANDAKHKKCLETVKAAKGCKGVTWGVLEEDPKQLVWLVEWQTLNDHIEGFMNSSAYGPFSQDLGSFMESLKSLVHYPLETPPSKLLTKNTPLLEVFQVTLKEAVTFEQSYDACKPITDGWKKEGKVFATSPNMDEGATDQVLFLVPWKSSDEHKTAIKQDYYTKALDTANTMWIIETYGHITPLQ